MQKELCVKLMKLAVVIPLLALSLSSNAAFINTDWKVAGDAQAVLHEETGIEWLNVTHTMGMSIDEVTGEMNGQFSGWRLPSIAEINEMYSDFFNIHGQLSDTAVNYVGVPEAVASQYISLFGETYSSGDHYSIVNHLGSVEGYTYQSYVRYGGSDILYGNREYGSNTAGSAYNVGVFLVSDGGTTLSSQNDPSLNQNNPNYAEAGAGPGATSVPEPTSLAILGAGLMGFAFSRRKKQK